jgi:hypothetical protein
MTTYVQFIPQPTQAFIFSAQLDGSPVTCQVPWSLFANRWYLSMTDTSGLLIVYRAMAASPDPIVIKSMTWDADDGVFVETITPHMFDFMSTCELTIQGVTPTVLNGVWPCFITGPTTFSYQPAGLAISPIQSFGQVSYDINLAEGYFTTSTLVFRQSTQAFEINP